MPELPEVETIRRGLQPVLVGKRFESVELRRPDLRFAFPARFCERLIGHKIEALGRRAKYLQAHLSSGETLVMHLGMSGRFTILGPLPAGDGADNSPGKAERQQGQGPEPRQGLVGLGQELVEQGTRQGLVGQGLVGQGSRQPGNFVHGGTAGSGKHDHVLFQISGGHDIIYNDARRFGFMLLIDSAELDGHRLFCKLGPEPLGNELDAAYLASAAQARKCDLKAFLMDQRNIAGLGNIYVCEALFRAGLSPDRRAATLSSKTGKPLPRAEALVLAIREVLQEAITAGGSTLRDYKKTDGSLGYFQHGFAVYGREGAACINPGCSGKIARKVHAGRSTFHCCRCQK